MIENRNRSYVALGTVLAASLGLIACGADDRDSAVAAGGFKADVPKASRPSARARSASADASSSRSRRSSTAPVVRLSVEPRLAGTARTYRDRKDRLQIRLPTNWHVASESATERVSLMADVLLAVGTSPIRPAREAACSEAADEPRVSVEPNGALVVVEEDVRARADSARKRPPFRLLKQVAPPGKQRRARTGVFPSWNCRNEVGVSGLHETSFAYRGRVFSVAAIIGEAATAKTRSMTLAVLNSLKPVDH